jgi:GDP-mannose transporter
MLQETVSSSTLFTIVGIVCKILTVIINLLIWDRHAGLEGMAMLLVCVLAGAFYQQAQKRLQSSGNDKG